MKWATSKNPTKKGRNDTGADILMAVVKIR